MGFDYEFAKESAGKIEQIHGPFWTAHKEFSKTLTSLSSGSLVLTVTFVDKLGSAAFDFRYFLIGAWIFLGLSAVTSVASMWFGIQLSGISPRLFNSASKFKEAITSNDSKEKREQEWNTLFAEVTKPIVSHESSFRRLLQASGIFLGLGLVSLILFGVLVLQSNQSLHGTLACGSRP